MRDDMKWITFCQTTDTYCSWGLTRSGWRTWRHVTRLCRYTRNLTRNIRWAWTWANRWHSRRMRTRMCTKARVHWSRQGRASRWRWLNRRWIGRCGTNWGNITIEQIISRWSATRGECENRTREQDSIKNSFHILKILTLESMLALHFETEPH